MQYLRWLSSAACLAMALQTGAASVAAQVPAREFVAITGRVIDLVSREPIEGVTVVLEGTGLRFQTNAGGEFIVDRIAIGSYRLQLSHPEYNPAVGDFVVWRAGQFQTEMAPVAMVGSEVITGIMGVLTDRNTGDPLAGARVQLDGGVEGTLTDGRLLAIRVRFTYRLDPGRPGTRDERAGFALGGSGAADAPGGRCRATRGGVAGNGIL